MSDDGKVSSKNIALAVDVAKAVLPMPSGSLISQSDLVAKFIETVAKKLESLER
jgi:hypothetical protein